MLCVGALALAVAFFGEPSGQGAAAQRGYKASEPLIEALNRYHESTGEYPADLEALLPA